MARPGKDLIHFVTVVHSLMHDTAGWELCARYTHMAKCLLTDTEVNVLVGVGGARRGDSLIVVQLGGGTPSRSRAR